MLQFECLCMRLCGLKPLNFGTPQFWKGPPILVDWGSQGPLIFKASGNPVEDEDKEFFEEVESEEDSTILLPETSNNCNYIKKII